MGVPGAGGPGLAASPTRTPSRPQRCCNLWALQPLRKKSVSAPPKLHKPRPPLPGCRKLAPMALSVLGRPFLPQLLAAILSMPHAHEVAPLAVVERWREVALPIRTPGPCVLEAQHCRHERAHQQKNCLEAVQPWRGSVGTRRGTGLPRAPSARARMPAPPLPPLAGPFPMCCGAPSARDAAPGSPLQEAPSAQARMPAPPVAPVSRLSQHRTCTQGLRRHKTVPEPPVASEAPSARVQVTPPVASAHGRSPSARLHGPSQTPHIQCPRRAPQKAFHNAPIRIAEARAAAKQMTAASCEAHGSLKLTPATFFWCQV